ncbi:MAG TPA: hypothetical protein VL092_02350 [Chitinophagaceae bacterium]|nr:hypothetical protein [Chitinophagaceae bacterium]
MKKIMTTCSLLTVFAAAQGQSTGTLMFGANVLSSSVYHAGNTQQVQNFQARVGYFVSNKVAVGLCLETGLNDNKAVPFGLTLMSRYYAGKKTQQVVKIFAEVGAGLADNKLVHAAAIGDDMYLAVPQSSLQGTAYFTTGISIFPAHWVALELGPEYRYVSGQNYVHRLGVSAGIKIFAGERAFKKTFPNKFHSLY